MPSPRAEYLRRSAKAETKIRTARRSNIAQLGERRCPRRPSSRRAGISRLQCSVRRDTQLGPESTAALVKVRGLAKHGGPAEGEKAGTERERCRHTAELPAASCAANFVWKNAFRAGALSRERRHIMRL